MSKRKLTLGMIAVIAGMVGSSAAFAQSMSNAQPNNSHIPRNIMAAMEQCERVAPSCGSEIPHAYGVLVFPSVVKADLIVGGSGGKGTLIENGVVTGYYNLGSGSVGLQAGVDKTSQVYVFRTPQAVANLKNSPDWKAGASAGFTLINSADENTSALSGKDVLAYVFDGKGLHGGVSLDLFDIWQSGQPRPRT